MSAEEKRTSLAELDRKAFVAAAIWLKASSAADALISGLLTDDEALNRYLSTNASRLKQAYARMTSWLDQHRLPYIPATAGHFLMADLRRFMPTLGDDGVELVSDAERETKLWLDLLDGGVYLAPGSFVRCDFALAELTLRQYSNPTSGWFRITFSVNPVVLEEGLRRLERILGLGKRGEAPNKRDSVRFNENVSLAFITEALQRADLQCC